MRTNSLVITPPTYEVDAEHLETANHLDDLVQDKCEGWQANSSKARRRQLRYKKRLTTEKDVEKQKLMKAFNESSKSQEDKFTAALVITNQDSQKAAEAFKSLMSKK